jgi:probable HAF family extracellular repeat protein
MTGLGIPEGTHNTRAFGVSDDGKVVVGTAVADLGRQRAFRWENGNMVLLGSLPGGAPVSSASDVSAKGRVIVGKANSTEGAQAFAYEAGQFRGLGDLAGGAFRSIAYAISADGKVIVGRSETHGDILEAVRWRDGAIEALGARDAE